MYLYDSDVNILTELYDINIAFDIRDDFSGGVYFSNILSGNDWIVGNSYSDYLEAGSGNDVVRGNSGNDVIFGQNGSDKLYGGSGGDRLNGGSWGDKLFGGSGSDRLYGQSGNDKLYGGSGKDTMFGGSGADTFVFNKMSDSRAASSKADVIKDFKQGVDHIDLRSIDASSDISGNNAFTFDGTTQFGTSKSGDIYYDKFNLAGTSRDYTMIYIDNDADRGVEMSIRLDGLINITASDFLL
jgi:Ca2+-binding RTX toxin-like protein